MLFVVVFFIFLFLLVVVNVHAVCITAPAMRKASQSDGFPVEELMRR